jgi:hypothetical protein
MSGIAKVDAVVIFAISNAAVLLSVGGISVGSVDVPPKVINCKPDRLVIVEYAPMHLKGYYARVPALVIAAVFTPPIVSLIAVSACQAHVHAPPERSRVINGPSSKSV